MASLNIKLEGSHQKFLMVNGRPSSLSEIIAHTGKTGLNEYFTVNAESLHLSSAV